MARETWLDRGHGEAGGGPAPTIREVGGDEPGVGSASPLLRLPEALWDWRIERELASRGAEADVLLVADAAGERRVAKIYRAGIEPKTDVLERVSGTSFEHVVRLFKHGQSDGRWYELLKYVEHGSLEDLIRVEGPQLAEPRIREILAEMAGAIGHLHACDVVHRDIKPGNILARSLDPLDLVLADFGIASMLGEASRRFTSTHRTIAYAAPETAAGEVSRAADWWSLGMILIEVLTGRHPFAGLDDRVVMSRLFQMPVDQLVEGIAEPWRLLCRGLLRREAKNRWGHDEIERWLRGDKTLTVTAEAAPGAAGHASFFFAGQRYGTLADIAHALGENWPEARKAVERGHLLNWVKDDLKDNEWRQFLANLDRDCDDLDERVFRIILKANPNATPVLCGCRLDPQGLERLAQEAIANRAEAKAILQTIRKRVIFRLAADGTGNAYYSELGVDWTRLLGEYQDAHNTIAQAGGPSPGPDEPLAEMLLAVLPGSREAYVARLRAQAKEASQPDALECRWFRELAKGSDTSIADLLLVPLLANAAESETRNRRQAEEAEQRQRRYDEAYWNYSVAAGSAVGILGGLVVGFIPCWIISGIASAIGGIEAGWRWYASLMFVFAIVGIAVGLYGAFESRWRRWVASVIGDSSEIRTIGLLITIPSLAIAGGLIVYWVNLHEIDIKQARARAQQQESQRLSGFVTDVRVGTNIDKGGQLSGVGTTLRGPTTSVVGYVSYTNGFPGFDRVVLTLSGNGVTSPCQPYVVEHHHHSVWCK